MTNPLPLLGTLIFCVATSTTAKLKASNGFSSTNRLIQVNQLEPIDPVFERSFIEEDARFENKESEIMLSGTLTIPKGIGKFPCVVFISGSGPHSRDSIFAGHPLFKVLAEHLSNNGIAVLRYDDRGVGESEGDFASASPVDFSSDALSAIEFLNSHDSIRKNQIGILGHSEGSIAALIAVQDSEIPAFLITLAGPGVPGIDGIKTSVRASSKANGISTKVTNLNLKFFTEFAEIIEKTTDHDEAKRLMKTKAKQISDSAKSDELNAPGSIAPALSQIIDQFNEPNTRFVLNFDPQSMYSQIQIPTLVLYGKRDSITPYRVHATAVERALRQSGANDTTVESIPSMNHLFQRAKTGSPAEFGQIEETMSPIALERISSWISDRFGEE
tara:strand:+ start:13175 stop:14335 length:1161 start_codon:yes stop_codon:yes gene_type:complete